MMRLTVLKKWTCFRIRLASFDEYKIYPANLFMTTKESQLQAIYQIEDDLAKEVAKFEEEGKHYEAKRLYERVTYDMEMIRGVRSLLGHRELFALFLTVV